MRPQADTRASLVVLGERLREAEAALVATAIYARGVAASMVGAIDGSALRQEAHKALWQAVERAVRDGREPTELELIAGGLDMAHLDAVRGMEFEVAGARSGEDSTRTWRAALTAMRTHAVLEAGQSALARAAFTSRDVLEAAMGVAPAITTLCEELAVDRGTATMEEAMQAFVAETRSGRARQVVGSWGLPEFDERLGSLRAGTLSVVIAFPGHGKSSFGLQAARATAKRGGRVLYVTTEMLRGELAMRLLCAEEHLTPRDLEIGIRRGEGVADDMREWGRLIVPEDKQRHVDAIAAQVRSARLQGRPYSVVVADYLQMLTGPGDGDYERMSYVAYRLKQLALEDDCAVLSMAQVNRTADRMDVPSMRTIRGSSAIEDAADAIVAAFRHDREKDGPSHYVVKAAIEKARNGSPGLLRHPLCLGAGTFNLWQPSYPPESVEERIPG